MMMTLSSSFLSAVALFSTCSHAFVVVTPSSSSPTLLFSATQQQQQQQAPPLPGVGGGVPVHPAGDRHLFDPALEGKLGGTDNLDQRLAAGSNYLSATAATTGTATTTTTTTTIPAQHWLLEDANNVPPAPFAKATKPVTATVLGRGKLIADEAPGDIQHIVLQLPNGMHYVEGQSLSVLPPGTDAKTGKPYKPRLYSIARYVCV